jgi:hypothetical protein
MTKETRRPTNAAQTWDEAGATPGATPPFDAPCVTASVGALPPQSRTAHDPFGRAPESEFRSCMTTFITPRKGEPSPVVPLHGRDCAIRFLKLTVLTVICPDERQITLQTPRFIELLLLDSMKLLEGASSGPRKKSCKSQRFSLRFSFLGAS